PSRPHATDDRRLALPPLPTATPARLHPPPSPPPPLRRPPDLPRSVTNRRMTSSHSSNWRLQPGAENDDFHRLAGRDSGLAGDDREAVGGDHGAQDAGALGAGEAREVPVVGGGERHAEVAAPGVPVADRLLR